MQKSFGFLFCALVVSSVFLWGLLKPIHNWDIIGYVAASYYDDGLRTDRLQEATFTDLKEELSPEMFVALTSGDEYRSTVYSNPESLQQQIPFYSIRMVYVNLIKFTSDFGGMTRAKATYVVSSFFAALSVVMLLLLFPLHGWKDRIVFIAALLFAGFLDLAAFSTPDSMACFAALLAVYLFIKQSKFDVFVIAIMPFIRTDLIILCGVLLGLNFIKGRRIGSVLCLVFSLCALVWINRHYSNYGHLTVFNFTLIKINPFPATMQIATDAFVYLKTYWKGIKSFFENKHMLLFAPYVYLWWKIRRRKFVLAENELFVIVWAFIGLHMILFPIYFERFFVWCVFVSVFDFYALVKQRKPSQ